MEWTRPMPVARSGHSSGANDRRTHAGYYAGRL